MSKSDSGGGFPVCEHCGKLFIETPARNSHERACEENSNRQKPGVPLDE